MPNSSVDIWTDVDGSVVVQPLGALDDDCAVQLRQALVHAVRKMRPLRLVLDLSGVTDVDPINLGTVAALIDLADDHRVVVFVDSPRPAITELLQAAGVPRQRLRVRQTTPAG